MRQTIILSQSNFCDLTLKEIKNDTFYMYAYASKQGFEEDEVDKNNYIKIEYNKRKHSAVYKYLFIGGKKFKTYNFILDPDKDKYDEGTKLVTIYLDIIELQMIEDK